jgi:hypothetical protein
MTVLLYATSQFVTFLRLSARSRQKYSPVLPKGNFSKEHDTKAQRGEAVYPYSFFNLALVGVGGQRYAPAALPPGNTQYPWCRRLGEQKGLSGKVRKISPPPGFDPRTHYHVMSRYTEKAIAAQCQCYLRTQNVTPTYQIPQP